MDSKLFHRLYPVDYTHMFAICPKRGEKDWICKRWLFTELIPQGNGI